MCYIPSAPKYLLLGLPIRSAAIKNSVFSGQYSSKTWGSPNPTWTVPFKTSRPWNAPYPSVCEVWQLRTTCPVTLTLAKYRFRMPVWFSLIRTRLWTKFSLEHVAESKELLREGCCCVQPSVILYCFFTLQLCSYCFLVTAAYFNNNWDVKRSRNN